MGSLHTTAGTRPSPERDLDERDSATKTPSGNRTARRSASGLVFFQPKSVPTPMRKNIVSPMG